MVRTPVARLSILSLAFLCLFPIGERTEAKNADQDKCLLGEPIETDGYRRLALVVGIGNYRSDRVPDLKGSPLDARRFYALLTGPNGYGFPKDNVCLLLDENATTIRFKQVFEKALVSRARQGDVAVLFYAGHGSQAWDRNGDEPDKWDETFLFHDARTNGVRDLLDDELNQLLGRLHERTRHITVILDSCNSGTATRGEAGTYVARFQPPAEEQAPVTETTTVVGDGGADWLPEAMPGLVVFAAASDGTPALERKGRGIFTDAVLEVLAQVAKRPLTYAQAARKIPPLVAAESYQIPYFHGDLNQPVFGNEGRTRPMGWDVVAVKPALELRGPPLPGIGRNAELRIYDGAISGADTQDPSKAKALAVVETLEGLSVTARIDAANPDAPAVAQGDLAVLARPGDEALRISLRLRPAGEPDGVPEKRAAALRSAIASNAEASMLVDLTKEAGDFELSTNDDGNLVLWGPENRIRVTYGRDTAVPENLWQHARQRALLQLRGEGGADFSDNQTLEVRLVPARRQHSCARGQWVQADPNTEQIIPLCYAWNLQVKLIESSPKPLLVGAAVLSTDGGVFGFPVDGRKVLLHPGEQVTFSETFRGSPPLDVQDHLLVFGTQETNPVQWHLLTDTATTRTAEAPPKRGLYRALHRYLQPGTRGQEPLGIVEETTWTLTAVTMRVQAQTAADDP